MNEFEKSAWEAWETWKNSTWGNLIPVLIAQHADRTNTRKIKGGIRPNRSYPRDSSLRKE